MQQSYLPQNIQEVYQNLTEAGVRLRVDGDTLQASPKEKINTEARKLIQKYKPGLMALLNGQKVNDFQDSLEKGGNKIHRPFLEAVYKRAFYNFDWCQWSKSGNTAAQKAGCDVIIYLTNDRVVRVDEKLRYREIYTDIALEHISNNRYHTPGWMEKDLGIDYLNYAFVGIKRAYLFPWQQLKQVWINNKENWLALAKERQQGFDIVRAPNDSYFTLSCAVPTDLLIEKVKGAMMISID